MGNTGIKKTEDKREATPKESWDKGGARRHRDQTKGENKYRKGAKERSEGHARKWADGDMGRGKMQWDKGTREERKTRRQSKGRRESSEERSRSSEDLPHPLRPPSSPYTALPSCPASPTPPMAWNGKEKLDILSSEQLRLGLNLILENAASQGKPR